MSTNDLIQPLNHLGTVTFQKYGMDTDVFALLVLYRLAEMVAKAEVRELMINDATRSTTPIGKTFAKYRIVIDESLVYGRGVHKFDTGLLDMQKLMKRCGLNTDRITPTIVQKKRRFGWRHYFEITFTVT